MTAPPKKRKVRRWVLGEGYPWFDPLAPTIGLVKQKPYYAATVKIKTPTESIWKKCRLILEECE